MAPDPAEELSLWRYHLIAETLDRRIGSRERGLIVRRIAGEEHVDPDGQPRAVSRNTLDRWIRAYRQYGLSGLRDRPRSDQGSARRHVALIQEAVQLRLEQPARSAAQRLTTAKVSTAFRGAAAYAATRAAQASAFSGAWPAAISLRGARQALSIQAAPRVGAAPCTLSQSLSAGPRGEANESYGGGPLPAYRTQPSAAQTASAGRRGSRPAPAGAWRR